MIDVDTAEQQALILSGSFKDLITELLSLNDDDANMLQKRSIGVFHELLVQDNPCSVLTRSHAIHQSLKNGLTSNFKMLTAIDLGSFQMTYINSLKQKEADAIYALDRAQTDYNEELQNIDEEDPFWEEDNLDAYYPLQDAKEELSSIREQLAVFKQGSAAFSVKSFQNIIDNCGVEKLDLLLQTMQSWCTEQASEMISHFGHPPLEKSVVPTIIHIDSIHISGEHVRVSRDSDQKSISPFKIK